MGVAKVYSIPIYYETSLRLHCHQRYGSAHELGEGAFVKAATATVEQAFQCGQQTERTISDRKSNLLPMGRNLRSARFRMPACPRNVRSIALDCTRAVSKRLSECQMVISAILHKLNDGRVVLSMVVATRLLLWSSESKTVQARVMSLSANEPWLRWIVNRDSGRCCKMRAMQI